MVDKKRGTILITSLWILAILSILAIGIGLRVSVEARLAKYNMDRARALYLAKAGAVKALYRLSRGSNSYDNVYECGVTFSPQEKSGEEKFKAVFAGKLGDGTYSVIYKEGARIYAGAADEERRININTAPESVLKSLLIYIDEDATIASNIVQWRSPGPGLDDGYYQALPVPYECKHERFAAVEELLLVKGVEKKIYDKMKNYITAFGDAGKFTVNINTAPKEVLSTILMSGTSVSAPIDKTAADILSDRIVIFRSGPDRVTGTKDDVSFTQDLSIEAILPELSTQAAELKKYFTTKSSYFRIESEGVLTRSKVARKAVYVVQKSQGKIPTLKSYREY